MSDVPSELKYTKTHEWLRSMPNGTVEVGITDHAQSALGDLVFVDLPAVGRNVTVDEPCAVVESVKAASDVHSPVSGRVIASNAALASAPELVNQQPYGAGWLMRIEVASADFAAGALDAKQYEKYLADEASS